MSDSAKGKREQEQDGGLDLTRKLKSLKLPEQTVPGIDEYLEDRRKALLFCSDADVRKWGRRWLEREDLEVAIVDDPARGLYSAETIEPHVIVIEAGFGAGLPTPLIQALSESTKINAPIIALSANAKDLDLALNANVYDVVRKPYEWKLVGRRAGKAARTGDIEQDLEHARSRLSE
ncbi:MAG: response regulator, partial [Pseudomonadota bacterium]